MARAGCTYRFSPVLMDIGIVETGTIVRVVPASGLGVSGRLPSRFAYVEHLGGELIGMVCVNSLQTLTSYERRAVRRVTTPAKHRSASTRYVMTYGNGTGDDEAQRLTFA